MAKRKTAGRTKAARRATARKRGGARKSARRRAASARHARRRTAAKPARRRTTAAARARARTTAARQKTARARKATVRKKVVRTAPSLNRARRTIGDEGIVPSPPSSLDLDRTASAARSGRRELHEKFTKHTETSPAITGGDIDADWESAYSVGDEAPGGDNPTPDQDIVDDIGRAVGVEYEDNEELKGEKKISDRDKKRWELDPASSEDYKDR